ncbi:MAG: hypothetical protein IPJ50_09420 [Betaproteobacteria bacterium]|nr:hypothetical protein [Betaproteobacteria bacterium]
MSPENCSYVFPFPLSFPRPFSDLEHNRAPQARPAFLLAPQSLSALEPFSFCRVVQQTTYRLFLEKVINELLVFFVGNF